MKYLPVAMACSLLAPAPSAQVKQNKFVIPPTNPAAVRQSIPFAGAPMRFQQWYAPSEWVKKAKHPVRLVGIEFKAMGSGKASTLDLEVTIANGPPFGPTAQFDSNLRSGAVVAFPRARFSMPAGAPNTWPIKLTFSSLDRQFVWDGKSAVIVDVKLFSNGNANNQPFRYDFEYTRVSTLVTRLYAVGNNPRAIKTAVHFDRNVGIVTRFTTEEGMTISFAGGCPGTGGREPLATTTGGLPRPGNQGWTHVLSNVRDNRPAVVFFGTSNTQWGKQKLPLDLRVINAPPCFLHVEPKVDFSARTTGGRAKVTAPIPPVTVILGFPVYTQWFVLDPGASNGFLAGSNALWTIIGP